MVREPSSRMLVDEVADDETSYEVYAARDRLPFGFTYSHVMARGEYEQLSMTRRQATPGSGRDQLRLIDDCRKIQGCEPARWISRGVCALRGIGQGLVGKMSASKGVADLFPERKVLG